MVAGFIENKGVGLRAENLFRCNAGPAGLEHRKCYLSETISVYLRQLSAKQGDALLFALGLDVRRPLLCSKSAAIDLSIREHLPQNVRAIRHLIYVVGFPPCTKPQ